MVLATAVTSFQALRSISRPPKSSKRQGHVTANSKVRANVPAGLGGNRFLKASTRYRPPTQVTHAFRNECPVLCLDRLAQGTLILIYRESTDDSSLDNLDPNLTTAGDGLKHDERWQKILLSRLKFCSANSGARIRRLNGPASFAQRDTRGRVPLCDARHRLILSNSDFRANQVSQTTVFPVHFTVPCYFFARVNLSNQESKSSKRGSS